MTTRDRHVIDALLDHVDGRLDPAVAANVTAHLEVCETCRRAWDEITSARAALASLRAAEVPQDLATRLARALDDEASATGTAAPPTPAPVVGPRRAWWIATAAAAAVILAAIYVLWPRPSIPDEVARDFIARQQSRLELARLSDDPAALNRWFAEQGLAFPARVLDLEMMGYALEGGLVHSVRGQASALFSYRRADGRRLVCQMFEAAASVLPVADEVRQHNGFTFHVYRRERMTLVFWQEGRVLCVLTSNLPREEVTALAFAKAMLP